MPPVTSLETWGAQRHLADRLRPHPLQQPQLAKVGAWQAWQVGHTYRPCFQRGVSLLVLGVWLWLGQLFTDFCPQGWSSDLQRVPGL